jgi:hypothetical protein
VQRELAVALVRVQVADVQAGAVDGDGADERRARAHLGDVHVAVGALCEVGFGGDAVVVVGADEALAEVAGVVRVGDRHRRGGADVADERPQPPDGAGHPLGLIQQDGVLSGVRGDRHHRVCVGRERVCRVGVEAEAHARVVVERDGVAELEAERRGVRTARRTPDGVLAGAVDDGVGPGGAAAGADVVDERVGVVRGIAHAGAVDVDGPGHLVAAAERGGDHRRPPLVRIRSARDHSRVRDVVHVDRSVKNMCAVVAYVMI